MEKRTKNREIPHPKKEVESEKLRVASMEDHVPKPHCHMRRTPKRNVEGKLEVFGSKLRKRRKKVQKTHSHSDQYQSDSMCDACSGHVVSFSTASASGVCPGPSMASPEVKEEGKTEDDKKEQERIYPSEQDKWKAPVSQVTRGKWKTDG